MEPEQHEGHTMGFLFAVGLRVILCGHGASILPGSPHNSNSALWKNLWRNTCYVPWKWYLAFCCLSPYHSSLSFLIDSNLTFGHNALGLILAQILATKYKSFLAVRSHDGGENALCHDVVQSEKTHRAFREATTWQGGHVSEIFSRKKTKRRRRCWYRTCASLCEDKIWMCSIEENPPLNNDTCWSDWMLYSFFFSGQSATAICFHLVTRILLLSANWFMWTGSVPRQDVVDRVALQCLTHSAVQK